MAEVLTSRRTPTGRRAASSSRRAWARHRGPLATVLVQKGTLHLGDIVVVGETMGSVKAMFNEHGQRIKSAGPSAPAKVLGLSAVPQAGEVLRSCPTSGRRAPSSSSGSGSAKRRRSASSTRHPRHAVRRDQRRQAQGAEHHPQDGRAGQHRADPHVARTPQHRRGEASRSSTPAPAPSPSRTSCWRSRRRGSSSASTRGPSPAPCARRTIEGVDIHHYNIIYELVEDVEKALKGLHEPVFKDVIDGHAEVRQVFKVSARATSPAATCATAR